MKISKELYTFFKEWLEWSSQPKVVDTRNFSKDEGLCSCLSNWSSWLGYNTVSLHSELIKVLEVNYNGNYQFPFDKNLENYWNSKKKAVHHKNPKRLAFVREQIALYESYVENE